MKENYSIPSNVTLIKYIQNSHKAVEISYKKCEHGILGEFKTERKTACKETISYFYKYKRFDETSFRYEVPASQ